MPLMVFKTEKMYSLITQPSPIHMLYQPYMEELNHIRMVLMMMINLMMHLKVMMIGRKVMTLMKMITTMTVLGMVTTQITIISKQLEISRDS